MQYFFTIAITGISWRLAYHATFSKSLLSNYVMLPLIQGKMFTNLHHKQTFNSISTWSASNTTILTTTMLIALPMLASR